MIVSLATLLLALGLASSDAPRRLPYGRCGPDAHTESYPNARHTRHAYGCKSDDDGFLEGARQGDAQGN